MSLVKQSKIPIKTSNLAAAIKQLDGQSYRVDKPHEYAPPMAFQAASGGATIGGDRPAASKNISLEQIAEQLRAGDAPLNQSRQLVEHIRQKEKALAQQEADHQVSVWNWQQQVANQQRALDAKQTDLDEQEIQLRTLQFELLQLQNELIDSQLATREIVNQLGVPELQNDALDALRFELNQRFDHVMIRWRQFAGYMQDLANSLADEVAPIRIEL
jgi:chromosome segregation ATPase